MLNPSRNTLKILAVQPNWDFFYDKLTFWTIIFLVFLALLALTIILCWKLWWRRWNKLTRRIVIAVGALLFAAALGFSGTMIYYYADYISWLSRPMRCENPPCPAY